MTAGYKNIFTAEPVQWAVDYIQDILETLEGAVDNEYGLALLSLEREELRGIWHELCKNTSQVEGTVHCGFGHDGARLFVIRQLLCALPAVDHCPLYNNDTVFSQACKRLLDEHFFLRSFRLPLDQRAPTPDLVSRALGIVMKNGLADRLLLGNHPLHLYCINYELPSPAYYLYPSHTIVCGTNNFEPHLQLHCLLHELGHVIYATKQAGKHQLKAVARKKTAEQFANRFAATFLSPV
jgi:hypothetical protein